MYVNAFFTGTKLMYHNLSIIHLTCQTKLSCNSSKTFSLKNEHSYFRYVRALGAMYMRLVGTSLDVYNYLEPLLNDYRKLKVKNKMGGENNCDNSVHSHLSEDDCKSFQICLQCWS